MNYDSIAQKFLALTRREKTLILSGISILILFIGFTSFIEPIHKQKADFERSVTQKKVDLVRLDREIASLEIELQNDPNKPLLERKSQIEAALSDLDEMLRNQTFDLIPPEEMSQVLEQVLAKSGELKLIELSSIAPKTVVQTAIQGGEQINLYQHGVKIVLDGTFFAVQKYLEQIENLNWQFYWRLFDYQVIDYPNARVEIDLYTLSTSQAFIGV